MTLRVDVGHRPSGFTLIEVLIALAVASIVFLGGLKLVQTVSQSLFESRDRNLAMLCADNALVLVRLQVQRQGFLSAGIPVGRAHAYSMFRPEFS